MEGSGRVWAAALLGVLLTFGAVPSRAETLDGVTFPPTLTADGQVLHLNGAGIRTLTVLNVHGYAAALYLQYPSHDTQAIEASPGIKMLILEYLRDASQSQVQDVFRSSAKRYCAARACPPSDTQDFERLAAAFPAVKRGETTTYLFTRQGLQVFMDNKPLISFDNPDLAEKVLDVFIGPLAAQKSLREALLGENR